MEQADIDVPAALKVQQQAQGKVGEKKKRKKSREQEQEDAANAIVKHSTWYFNKNYYPWWFDREFNTRGPKRLNTHPEDKGN